ncbi:RNA polymerase-associated protein LEO1-like [Neltuma alba]|uniref:RNA polymerase-associated protein LEO1-like n=1 Tax=Neltuma alba TaxID=207710 RepID=UPI0010A59399|nr:RNA polymerase-associated protein LEO1-like [Prosopis alba]XP_028785187.1 RNA polymerase-associated protein LEO1-like [Prosopis alba]
MPKRDISDSESEDANENSSSEEAEAATHGHPLCVSEYEKQRLCRIAENRARLKALGLPKMASSLKCRGHNVTDEKGKKKVGDDEEYVPDDAEARLSSSSGEDGHDDDDDDDEDFVGEKASRSRKRKVKKNSSKAKARLSKKDPCNKSHDIDDDDEALKQAIALSLQESVEGSCLTDKHVANTTHVDTKREDHIQEDKGRRKNKKSFTSRLQMTEDEVIVHFFEIDETGKGSVIMRDLQRVAAAHDFVWTDKELSDMIHYFDSDNDGKLSLDDFRKIIVRCNMTKGSESS